MSFISGYRGNRSSNTQVARALGVEIVTGVCDPGDKLPGDAEILRIGAAFDVLRDNH